MSSAPSHPPFRRWRRSSGAAFPIEQVRAAFPALEREVHGRPVAYLDSGASAQRVARLDPGGRPLRAPPPLERPPRRPHALGRGDRRLRGRPRHGRRPHRRRRPPRGGLRPQRRPRRSTWSPTPGAPRNVGAGDRIVLTEMEHHSNIVPWQLLAARAGAELDWVPVTDDGAARHRRLRGAARARAEARRRRPRLERARHREPARRDRRASPTRRARWCSPTAPRRRRSWPSTSPRSGSTSTGSPATRPTRRPASARSGAASTCSATMPPFMGGGSMIRKVTKAGTTWADPPARFEAGTPAIAQAIGLAAAFRWLDALGMDAAAAHEREIAAYALERLAEVPGLRVFGPPRVAGPARPGLVRARGRPRPRRRGDPRPPRRRGPRRPPLRPAADGAARGRRYGPRQLRRLHDPRRDRPPGRRPARRPPGLRARLNGPPGHARAAAQLRRVAVRLHLGARRAVARASHAIADSGNVWLVDPAEVGEAIERALRSASRPGCSQLLDRHNRDCAAIASGSGSRICRVPDAVVRLAVRGDRRGPHSRLEGDRALVARATDALVVAEVVGTNSLFTGGRGGVGMHTDAASAATRGAARDSARAPARRPRLARPRRRGDRRPRAGLRALPTRHAAGAAQPAEGGSLDSNRWTSSTARTSSTTTSGRATSAGRRASTSTSRTRTRSAATSSTCSSRLGDGGRVAEVTFEGKGCAISTAATSMLTEELERQDPRGAAATRQGLRPRPARDRHLGDADEVRAARAQGRQVGRRSATRPTGRTRAPPAIPSPSATGSELALRRPGRWSASSPAKIRPLD